MGISTGEVATASDVRALFRNNRLVSDILRNSNDTQKSTSVTTYTKLKEVKLNDALANCRLKFDMSREGSNPCYSQIYLNGSATGTERTLSSSTEVTYSEDFTGWVSGDLIQIYGRSGGLSSVQVNDMRFYYSEYFDMFKGISLATPSVLLTTTNPTISVINQDP